jgi:hypothetical protein
LKKARSQKFCDTVSLRYRQFDLLSLLTPPPPAAPPTSLTLVAKFTFCVTTIKVNLGKDGINGVIVDTGGKYSAGVKKYASGQLSSQY